MIGYVPYDMVFCNFYSFQVAWFICLKNSFCKLLFCGSEKRMAQWNKQFENHWKTV